MLVLQKIAAYVFPEKVTILEKNVSKFSSVSGDADELFLEDVNDNGKALNHEDGNEER
jgi:hypothetical protein